MKYILQMISIFSLLFLRAFGQETCNDCKTRDWCFEIGAEWLYMLPAYDQPYFVIGNLEDQTNFNADRISNSQTRHSGYRIEAKVHLPYRSNLAVRWTSFPQFSDSRNFSGTPAGSLLPTLNDPFANGALAADASILDRFHFYNLEVLYGKFTRCFNPVILNLAVGLQFSRLDFDETVRYFIPGLSPILIENQSRMKGIGPEIAMDFSYRFCCGLSIDGRAAGTYLVTERDSKFAKLIPGLIDTYANSDTYWLGSPVLNFRIGVSYCYLLCSCLGLNLQIGYEFMHYFKGVERIFFVDQSDLSGASFTQQMDFILHGPYVSVAVGF